MLTLTPEDITAIADEIEARLLLRERQTKTQAEIAMVDAGGIDPVQYLKDKARAGKGQRRNKPSVTTTVSTGVSTTIRTTTAARKGKMPVQTKRTKTKRMKNEDNN